MKITTDDDLPAEPNRKHDVVGGGSRCVLPWAKFDHPTDHYRHYPSVKQIIKPQHDKVTATLKFPIEALTTATLIALSISFSGGHEIIQL